MDVVVAFDKNFIRPTCVMLHSLLSVTTRNLRIHLLVTDDLDTSNYFGLLKKLEVDFPNHRIIKYVVPNYMASQEFLKMDGVAHFSNAAIFRIFMSSILPSDVDQILYLDGDLLILDTSELGRAYDSMPIFSARLELGPSSIYWITKYPKKYFNSGVFTTSLNYWRLNDIEEKMINFLVANNGSIYKDQDALNEVFSEINLPLRLEANYPSARPIVNILPEVIHFVGNRKPWLGHVPKTRYVKLWRREYKAFTGEDLEIKLSLLLLIKREVIMLSNLKATIRNFFKNFDYFNSCKKSDEK